VKQYLSANDLGDAQTQVARYKQWKKASKCMTDRKHGIAVEKSDDEPKRKMRRTKTYVSIMNSNNMLRHCADCTLKKFHIEKLADGSWPDPFSWPHLNFSTDKGPDMVCEDHAYAYLFGLNTNRDYDLSHGTHRSGAGTLKKCGLWRHEVLMMSCQNIMYGSTLSPSRMAQIKETVHEYFGYADETDQWFLLHLPMIVKQLFPDMSMSDPDIAKVISFCFCL
jgi:hypothetical protein